MLFKPKGMSAPGTGISQRDAWRYYMKVLVTGGAGFIGSHLARALLRAGHSVRVIDNLRSGHLERIQSLLPDLEWIEADVCDPVAAARSVRGTEIVFHLAAIAS